MRLILLLLSISSICYSQDTVRLRHKNYTSVYSKSLRYPVLVEWWETRSKTFCLLPLERKNNFSPDPLLNKDTDVNSSYYKSGLDRGHMSPAASNECSGTQVLDESFYFSNIVPQYHDLNAGAWADLEKFSRNLAKKYDSVHVWCGSIGVAKKIGKVSVPIKCWKVIYISKTKRYIAYIFDNVKGVQQGIKYHEIRKSDLEKLIKLKIQ